MLQRQIFIASHLGAGSSMLIEMVMTNRRAGKIRRSGGQVYADLTDLLLMQEEAKRQRPHARMFFDAVTHNYEIMNRRFMEECEFIFLLREPKGTFSSILSRGLLKPESALRYYSFRLRRLCEMAKKTPKMIVITWDDLVGKICYPEIKRFLGIKELTSIYRPEPEIASIPNDLLINGRKTYERHLHFLRELSFARASKIEQAA